MPFARPSLQDLRQRVEADLVGAVLGVGALLRRSLLQILAWAVAAAAHLLHGHLEWNSRQLFPDTADAAELDRWASLYGVLRKAAAFAQGSATFTGSNGVLIPAGTRMRRADAAEYATDADAVVAGGTATAAVTAVLAGTAGNAPAATALTLTSPIAGLSSSAVVAAGGLIDGADVEDDTALRARVIARIQQPPQGGAADDYETWALEVSGVTRAWVYSEYLGPGTVGVTFVMDEQTPSIIPSAGKVDEVQDYIDARRPVTAAVTVFAPVADALNFTIDLTPDTAAVRSAVEAALQDLLRREASPGGTLLISRIREAISTAAGESDHVLTTPTANVVSTAGQIKVFGVITWS
ncbi:MAG: baseplate J/gp47 family protein [Planctomycetota bacterium]|nr:MAG: baseplate J/gp47 family protein [Planctomycetota bacterium]